MVRNPVGFVPVFGREWDVISGRARETISGGDFVGISGATGVVSSGAASFNPSTDLLFVTAASGNNCIGIALATTGSNSVVSVARRGDFIVQANGTLLPGAPASVDGNNAMDDSQAYADRIGHALTSVTSGQYGILRLLK